jgi:hypothetical protein
VVEVVVVVEEEAVSRIRLRREREGSRWESGRMRQAVLKRAQAEWAELAISEINQWGRWQQQPASQPASKQASKSCGELEPGFLNVEKDDLTRSTFF